MIRDILHKTLIGFAAVAAGVTMFGAQAQAQALAPAKDRVPVTGTCNMTMTPEYSAWVVRYDPIAAGEPIGEFKIVYDNKGTDACVGKLTVVSDGNIRLLTSRTGAPSVPYQLRDISSNANIAPGASGNLTDRTFTVPAAGRSEGLLRFTPNPPSDISAGIYAQNVRLRFVTDAGVVLAETSVALEFHVESSLLIGLAGEFRRVNGMATLDLGQLTQDGIVPLNAKVYVRASSGYQVTVTSQNGGYLRHDQPQWQIPYALSVGGQPINLSAPRMLTNNGTASRTDDYPLQISVSDIQAKRAGKYSDVLNFTVTAI